MSFNLTLRRAIARVLLVVVVPCFVVLPSVSYAFLPAVIAPIVYGGAASAGGTAVGSGAAGWGLLLGLGFAFVGLSDSNGNQARLPLTSDPSKAVPAPVAPATAVPVSGWSWSQAAGTCAGGSSGRTRNGFASLSAALADWAAIANTEPLCSPQAYSYSSNATQICYSSGGGAPVCYFPNGVFNNVTACPAGYTVSGSSCVLSDARIAQPDNNCDYTRSGSALAVLSDPDCGGGALQPDCNADGSVCTQTGTNPVTGRPRIIEIHTAPNGGSTIIQRDESLIGNTTVTDSTTVTISPAGVVDAVAGDTTTGPLPAPGTTPTGSPVQPQVINFPTDYARTGEASTAADRILDNIDSGFQNRTINGSDALIDANYDNLTNLPNTAIIDEPQAGFGWLPSLLPGQVTTCEKLPINTSFTTGIMAGISGNAEIDICPYLGGIRDIIGWLFWVATVMHVFYRFIYSGGRPL